MSTASGILIIGEYAGLLGAFCAGLGIGFLASRGLTYTGKLEMFDDLLGRAVTLLEEAATFLPRGIELEREITTFIRIARHERGGSKHGMTVNHVNGLKDDNRPENLTLSHYRDQMRHAHRSGLLDQHGQGNPAAKLRNNQVAQIRNAYSAGGHTMEALALRFGVAVQTISKIVRGQRRSKQGGPVALVDQRHCVSERDGTTGKFIGKARAGRLLDDIEHNDMPEARP